MKPTDLAALTTKLLQDTDACPTAPLTDVACAIADQFEDALAALVARLQATSDAKQTSGIAQLIDLAAQLVSVEAARLGMSLDDLNESIKSTAKDRGVVAVREIDARHFDDASRRVSVSNPRGDSVAAGRARVRLKLNAFTYISTQMQPESRAGIFSVEPRRKGWRFAKIIKTAFYTETGEPSRSVVGFVEAGTGLMWKAATFKAPALNFPRGCIFTLPDDWECDGSFDTLTAPISLEVK